MNLEKLNRMALKGSSIIDFVQVLDLMVDKSLITTIGKDVDIGTESIEETFYKNFITEYIIALKLKKFITQEFNIEFNEIEQFKSKIFRGNKLLNVVRFIDFEINYNSDVINEFYDNSYFQSDLENHKIKINFYKELKEFFIACFFETRKKRKDFINIWVQEFLGKDYELE